MPERQIKKLQRLSGPDGVTYCYFQRPGSRSRPWLWFEPWEVPDFEGPFALFECERATGHWRVLRRSRTTWASRPTFRLVRRDRAERSVGGASTSERG